MTTNALCRSDIELLGNIVTKQVTLRYFSDGTAITQFDLLVKKKTKPPAKERVDVFTVTARADEAERLKQYAKAGDGVVVKGRLRYQKDSEGRIISAIEAEQLSFIGAPTQLYWNKLTLVGQLLSKSSLRQSVNNQSYLKLQLATDDAEPAQLTSCNLWGYPAELVDKQSNVGDKLVIDGSLKKAFAEDLLISPVLVDGHTCVLINQF
ncbi:MULTISPECIES: single-stranded DNA-binding protein [unclassified Agarivorans]|uniref:single-stranded DNA-binding protein n=1 Tax=unclassified Agarivorans TaxID=2636026 RepID=UPI003D7CE6E7